ncbi:unnamed protein product [Lactuca virosa]|uniref:Uncharacterized protein n=1 Tax=Lactuca virosa TaxID=75947 RepID=A0AAU9LNT7_9ASTR|nr:unnamed protein product [Lactuca virosa]
MLIDGRRSFVINLVAPQLEHLTIINCSIDYLNAPPGLSSLCYTGDLPQQFSKDRFHSLNKVSICCYMYRPYKEKVARKAIKMLQELHSARYLTLNVDFVECLSSHPDLLMHRPSPFSNLICLAIDSSLRINDAYKVKMSTEARNFFLENSPNATFIMELPEPPPTKTMKQKEARAKKAKRAAEIASHMTEFQALMLDHENVERKQAKEKAKVPFEKVMAEMKAQVGKMHTETAKRLMEEFKICVEELRVLVKEEKAEINAIISKEALIRSLLENMPKRERTVVETCYSQQLVETEALHVRLASEFVASEGIFFREKLLTCILEHLASSSSTTTRGVVVSFGFAGIICTRVV